MAETGARRAEKPRDNRGWKGRLGLLLEGLLLVEFLNAFAFLKQDFPRFWPVGLALTLATLVWVSGMARQVHGYRAADLGLGRGQVGKRVWAFLAGIFLLGLALELRFPSSVHGPVTLARVASAGLFSVVYSPLYEELLFRGYLFRRIQDVWPGGWGQGWLRIRWASLLSSLFWALNHVPSLALLLVLGRTGAPAYAVEWSFLAQVFLLGIVAGELRARTHSIWPGTLLHAGMNSLFVLSMLRVFLAGRGTPG